ncbi:MAG TPA: hypothetical protein PK586_10125 [Casimicrobium sp.]|nr:hypothetical protein [Casimicrobium sp.]
MPPKKIAGLIAALLAISAHAEFYKVNIKRLDQNLYKSSSGLYIETRFCFEFALGEDAVLKYESYAYDNKLIFNSGTTCDVVKVFK